MSRKAPRRNESSIERLELIQLQFFVVCVIIISFNAIVSLLRNIIICKDIVTVYAIFATKAVFIIRFEKADMKWLLPPETCLRISCIMVVCICVTPVQVMSICCLPLGKPATQDWQYSTITTTYTTLFDLLESGIRSFAVMWSYVRRVLYKF